LQNADCQLKVEVSGQANLHFAIDTLQFAILRGLTPSGTPMLTIYEKAAGVTLTPTAYRGDFF
jgi:hypothetical protein